MVPFDASRITTTHSPVCRSAPAGLDRLTGLRAALSRQNADDRRGAMRGSNSPSSPPRRTGRGSPEGLRRQGERSSGLVATRLGGDGNCHNDTSSGNRPGGSWETRPGFLSSTRPMFPSSSASSYSTIHGGSGSSSSRQRPWTATAVCRTRAEAWRNADIRDGFGTGLSGAGASFSSATGKRRPRSASLRFHTSPGRERARSRSQPAGDERSGRKADGVAALPEGWAEAVDEESGHVYYYSDTR